MRILVLRISSMGDVVLASCVFPYVNSSCPGAEIHFVTGSAYRDLFVHDPRLARVYSLDDPADRASLQQQPWDWVIDLQNSRSSRRFVRAFAPPARLTQFDKSHLVRFTLLVCRIDRFDPARTVLARYLEAAGGGVGRLRELPRLFLDSALSSAATPVVDRVLDGLDRTRPMLGLVPFAAWKNKVWPGARYAAVARAFVDRGWSVVIFGGPADASAGRNLAQMIGSGAVSSAGALPLADGALLLSRCALCLGNDTGLCHLARAVGVRTGIIYGSTTRQWGFFPEGNPPFRVFERGIWCRPCHAHGGNFCYRGSRPCLTGVAVDEVVRGMQQLAEERG